MDPLVITPTTTIEDILLYAMQEEEFAAAFYRKAACRTADPHVKAFLLQMATKEDEHCQELRKKLEEMEADHFSVLGVQESFDSQY